MMAVSRMAAARGTGDRELECTGKVDEKRLGQTEELS